MPAKIEYTRLDLMGIGKPDSERSRFERRLGTIILCPAYTRTFAGVKDAHEWESLERTFHLFVAQFITSESEEELKRLSKQLVRIDDKLSRHCTGWNRDAAATS